MIGSKENKNQEKLDIQKRRYKSTYVAIYKTSRKTPVRFKEYQTG